MNLLFICSCNQWRSPTAKAVYKNRPYINSKSAGTEPSARIKLTAKMIDRSNFIFVMEKKHKQRIQERFNTELIHKEIIILDIPDEYKFKDEELIEDIQTKVNSFLSGL
ncbi:MAG TPA: protein tyrosine phosphatase [Bacteroidia bacterium]|nr:protein tyrosine phosphatase [Bacteroidia bacterium]